MKRKSNGRFAKKGVDMLNWRIWVVILTIVAIYILAGYGNVDKTYVREPEPEVFLEPVVVDHPEDESIETKIRKYFPRSHVTMLAIAKAESGLNNNAKNWNCYYYKGKATTTKIVGGSKACKVEDRHLAWSVDCFVLQANYPGRKTCPKDVTIDQHLKEMADLSRQRHFQPWVAYQLKMHEKHLAQQ